MGFQETHSIRGSVRLFSDGTPVANVLVLLAVFPERTIATTVTSTSGRFEFGNVQEGEYEIIIDDVNFSSVQQAVSVHADHLDGLEIFLRSKMPALPGPGGSVVSVHELSRPRKAREAMREGLELLYRRADYRGSLRRFEQAIQDDPTFYEAYTQVGVVQMYLRNSTASEAAFLKAIELSRGQYSDAYFLLAGLYSDTGRYADAQPLARHATALDPSRWQAHCEMARALLGLRRLPEAEASAATAVRLHPENPPLRLLLADIHMALRRYESVLVDLSNYLRLAPNGPKAEQAREAAAQIARAVAETPASGNHAN
jgi:tetratricopeptide (TPR) repeat protein